MSTANNYYVDNKQLNKAMIEFIADVRRCEAEGLERPVVPRYIADCILKIATRYSTKYNFINSSHYRDDMVMDAVENVIRYIHNFDPEKSSNPFSYFTQSITNAFYKTIEEEQTEDYVKHTTARQHGVMNPELMQNEIGEDGVLMQCDQESVSDFIRAFEEKKARKKADRKKRAAEKKASTVENFMVGEDEAGSDN